MLKDLIASFKGRPFWTAWSVALCPFYFLFVALAAVMLGVINLNWGDTIVFWNENT